ncbi:MFS transporter [Streptomyces sp. SHP 1-2]|uniref:MFS transporter n=1 Tax=Streptomyces sp. SHP 1-2 TaxID=2769489 RepID=UPI002237062D|nr:MFS transporter [Streptomyces sp. SHP 1-2]MCW5253626.1 MFS transporter [Streptomyces sp. SHP 1-2]
MTSTTPSAVDRRGLWALTATHAANDFYTGAVAALLPFFVLHAGYSYAAVAGITLAATALSSIAQPVFGHLGDRFGPRWMSLAGLLTAGAGVALSGPLSGSYAAVWIVMALSGVGVAAYHPAATMEAREAGGGTSGAMSLFSVGGNVGVALAPSAVLLVVNRFGLDGTGLLILPAIVLALAHIAVSGRRVFTRSVTAAPAPVTAGPAHVPDDWRAFGRLTLVLAMWSVAYVGTSTFVSLYSIERFGVSPGSASIALTVFPAAGALGTLAGGRLADRFGRLRTVRGGYLLAAVSMGAIVLAPAPSVVVVATAVLGLGLFVPFAAQITLSHSYLPNRIGVASGVTLGLTLSLGGVVSPLLGRVADRTGVRFVFVVLAALIALGFALSFGLRERRAESARRAADDTTGTEAETKEVRA